MRIPGYNGDMEEPWYWENYGRDIYEYSYYTDKDRGQQIFLIHGQNWVKLFMSLKILLRSHKVQSAGK